MSWKPVSTSRPPRPTGEEARGEGGLRPRMALCVLRDLPAQRRCARGLLPRRFGSPVQAGAGGLEALRGRYLQVRSCEVARCRCHSRIYRLGDYRVEGRNRGNSLETSSMNPRPTFRGLSPTIAGNRLELTVKIEPDDRDSHRGAAAPVERFRPRGWTHGEPRTSSPTQVRAN